jgi:hypothetical protein
MAVGGAPTAPSTVEAGEITVISVRISRLQLRAAKPRTIAMAITKAAARQKVGDPGADLHDLATSVNRPARAH